MFLDIIMTSLSPYVQQPAEDGHIIASLLSRPRCHGERQQRLDPVRLRYDLQRQ